MRPFGPHYLCVTNLGDRRFAGYAPGIERKPGERIPYFIRGSAETTAKLWDARGNEPDLPTIQRWVDGLKWRHENVDSDFVEFVDIGDKFLSQIVDIDPLGRWRINEKVRLVMIDHGWWKVESAPTVDSEVALIHDNVLGSVENAWKFWFNHVVSNAGSFNPDYSYASKESSYKWLKNTAKGKPCTAAELVGSKKKKR
jgi:hypothetical protein